MKRRQYYVDEILACKLIFQICCAVAYLHSYKILHRNIKPENILMTKDTDDTEIKLIGFSLAKILHGNDKLSEFAGTLHYCSPEILRHEAHSFEADVWAIGVVAYFILSGNLPFDGENSSTLTHNIINQPVSFPTDTWGNITREAKLLVASKLKFNIFN